MIDFTDPDKPLEMALLRPRPVDASAARWTPAPAARRRPRSAAPPSARGARTTTTAAIYSSEMARGLDILELTPSAQLSANEIEAAKLVRFPTSTTRRASRRSSGRPRSRWCGRTSTSCVRDQRPRRRAHDGDCSALNAAEQQEQAPRAYALNTLATQVDKDVSGSKDSAKVKMMADAIKKLASATK